MYFTHFWRLDIQDQGVGRFGWIANGHLPFPNLWQALLCFLSLWLLLFPVPHISETVPGTVLLWLGYFIWHHVSKVHHIVACVRISFLFKAEHTKVLYIPFWWSPVLKFCHSFGFIAKKLLPNPRSQRFTPVFSSKNFINLTLLFRSLFYLEFTFLYVLK